MSDSNRTGRNIVIGTAVAAGVGLLAGAAAAYIAHKQNQRNNDYSNSYESIIKRGKEAALLELLRERGRSQLSAVDSPRRLAIAAKISEIDTDSDSDSDSFITAKSHLSDSGNSSESDDDSADDDDRSAKKLTELEQNLLFVDKQIEGSSNNWQMALCTMRTLVEKHPNNTEVVWRFAKVCFKCFNINSTKEELLREGIKVCEPLLDEDAADVHKWYAVLIGIRAEKFASNGEQVKSSRTFQIHLEKALSLKPEDHELYVLRGRMRFVLAGLNWFQRQAAAALFGDEIPQASYADALEDFLLAKNIAELTGKPCREAWLYAGNCYYQLSEYGTALEFAKKVFQFNSLNVDDERNRTEALELQHKCLIYL